MQKILFLILVILSSGLVFDVGYALTPTATTIAIGGQDIPITYANSQITGVYNNKPFIIMGDSNNGTLNYNGRTTKFDFGTDYSVAIEGVTQLLESGNQSGTPNSTQATNTPTTTTASTSSGPMKIFTSEAVPGADCVCVISPLTPNDDNGNKNPDLKGDKGVACTGPVAKRKYECTVPTGLAGFQSVFAQIIRFVINIVLLLGVLSVVGLGIAWSFAGGDDIKAKSSLKKWAINILVGLAILFFFRYILLFLAPWVYQ